MNMIQVWDKIEEDFAEVERRMELEASERFWNERPKGWGKREAGEQEEAKSA